MRTVSDEEERGKEGERDHRCHCFPPLPLTGEPVFDEAGELVCVKPFPSQPTHFWNDEDGIKYTKAYFSMFKGKGRGVQGVEGCQRTRTWVSTLPSSHHQGCGLMETSVLSTPKLEASSCWAGGEAGTPSPLTSPVTTPPPPSPPFPSLSSLQ